MGQLLSHTVIVQGRSLFPIALPGDELPYLGDHYATNPPALGDLVVVEGDGWWMRIVRALPNSVLRAEQFSKGFYHLACDGEYLVNSQFKRYVLSVENLKRLLFTDGEFTLPPSCYLLLANDPRCYTMRNPPVICNPAAMLGKVLMDRDVTRSQNDVSIEAVLDKISGGITSRSLTEPQSIGDLE